MAGAVMHNFAQHVPPTDGGGAGGAWANADLSEQATQVLCGALDGLRTEVDFTVLVRRLKAVAHVLVRCQKVRRENFGFV